LEDKQPRNQEISSPVDESTADGLSINSKELTQEETQETIDNNQSIDSSKLSQEKLKAEDKLVIDDKTGDSTSANSNKLSPEEIKALRKKSIFRFIKYALIAASAGIIQIVSYIILADLIKLDRHVSFDSIYQKQPWLTEIFYDPESGKTYGLSYFIALTLSVIWNFTFNRKYTFKSASNVPKAMLLVALYYLVFTPLSCWWLVQLNKKMTFKFADKLILIMTMLINFITEFLYQRFVVFRKSIDTSVDKKEKE